MFDFLRGRLASRSPTAVTVDCHGVGYDVRVPLSTSSVLPDEGEVRLFVHLVVRDDALRLVGFATEKERRLFRMLLTVTGVGPAVAIAILSDCPVDACLAALRDGDVPRLVRIKGLGRKTAERMVIELKEKAEGLADPARRGEEETVQDAVAALLVLGYKRPEAERAVREAARKADGPLPLDALIRTILRS